MGWLAMDVATGFLDTQTKHLDVCYCAIARGLSICGGPVQLISGNNRHRTRSWVHDKNPDGALNRVVL